MTADQNPSQDHVEAIDTKRLITLVRRMDDLFTRSDAAVCPSGVEPYSDEEWDALRVDVRRALPEPSTQPGRSRLLILACSARKHADPAPIPAIERYDGPLWQTLRTVDPDSKLARVAFLSAHYGFRVATTPIERYDAVMTPERAREMIEGGTYTRWPRPKSWKQPLSGDNADRHIDAMSHDGLFPFDQVAIVGGGLYLDVMRTFVDSFRAKHYLTSDAKVTVINDTIGRMRQKLRTWLLGSEPA